MTPTKATIRHYKLLTEQEIKDKGWRILTHHYVSECVQHVFNCLDKKGNQQYYTSKCFAFSSNIKPQKKTGFFSKIFTKKA